MSSITPTKLPIVQPTIEPTIHTITPTYIPTVSSIYNATNIPTYNPTIEPKVFAICNPFTYPSYSPTTSISNNPTLEPIYIPSDSPTNSPTEFISTNIPTLTPTTNPTMEPTKYPTTQSTFSLSISHQSPTLTPTPPPSISPSIAPTTPPTMAYNFNVLFTFMCGEYINNRHVWKVPQIPPDKNTAFAGAYWISNGQNEAVLYNSQYPPGGHKSAECIHNIVSGTFHVNIKCVLTFAPITAPKNAPRKPPANTPIYSPSIASTYTFYSTNSLRYSSMTQRTNSPLNSLSIGSSITPTDASVMSAAILIIKTSLALNNQIINEKYVAMIVNEIELNIENVYEFYDFNQQIKYTESNLNVDIIYMIIHTLIHLYIHTHSHSLAICLILLLYPTLIANLIVETFVSVNKYIYIYIGINIYNEYGILTNITHAPIFIQTLKPTPIPISEPIIPPVHSPRINVTSSHTKLRAITQRKTPIASINAPKYSASIASSLSITYSPPIAAFDISSLAQYDAPTPVLAISAPTRSFSIAPSISSTVSLMYNGFGILVYALTQG